MDFKHETSQGYYEFQMSVMNFKQGACMDLSSVSTTTIGILQKIDRYTP